MGVTLQLHPQEGEREQERLRKVWKEVERGNSLDCQGVCWRGSGGKYQFKASWLEESRVLRAVQLTGELQQEEHEQGSGP